MLRSTSVQAYENLKDHGRLSLKRKLVYELIQSSGVEWTGGELNRELAPQAGNPSEHRGARWLVENGFLVEGAVRPCSVSGNECVTYRLPRPGEVTTVKVKTPPRGKRAPARLYDALEHLEALMLNDTDAPHPDAPRLLDWLKELLDSGKYPKGLDLD
jgi:hypothetical protein